MQTFDTDRQAAKPRRIIGGGMQSRNAASVAPVASGHNLFLRLTVERKRNGKALQWPSMA